MIANEGSYFLGGCWNVVVNVGGGGDALRVGLGNCCVCVLIQYVSVFACVFMHVSASHLVPLFPNPTLQEGGRSQSDLLSMFDQPPSIQ